MYGGGPPEDGGAGLRLKREDHNRTKHDDHFSKWKVLIGPNDWEEHSSGKEGVGRYRIENLPKSSGPGVYELGVAVARTGSGRDVARLNQNRIVVVYLGQADSVRTRLQQYGRSGAHLARTTDSSYFEDIFSRGYSLVYRLAPMENKAVALSTESQLLQTFDYAWNKGSNGARRPLDVLHKLDRVESAASLLSFYAMRFLPSQRKRVGIRINSNKLSLEENDISTFAESESYSFLSKVLKSTRSQPKLASVGLEMYATKKNGTSVCGVDLGGGSICTRPPVEGRKRCPEHKGMRTKSSVVPPNTIAKSELGYDGSLCVKPSKRDFHEFGPPELPSNAVKGSVPICGVALSDGSPCRRQPIWLRKRCETHKGQRISSDCQPARVQVQCEKLIYNSDALASGSKVHAHGLMDHHAHLESPSIGNSWDRICGVELGGGYLCTNQPVRGRVRCEEHKGLRVNGLLPKLHAKSKGHVYISDTTVINLSNNASASVCGAVTLNGSSCRRHVKGGGKCWQHQ